MVGYILLGAIWLVMTTSGNLQQRMRKRAWPLGIAAVILIGVIGLWTPFVQDGYYSRWFAGWHIGLAAGVGIAVLGIAAMMFRSLTIHKNE